MSTWFSEIDNQTQPIFTAICQHDFIKALTTGTLPKETFEFYIRQDSLYLAVYKKLLANIAARCDEVDECQFYLTAAAGVVEVELELHKLYAGKNVPTTASPSCELYNGFLANMVLLQPLSVAMAAVLPCFTIYQQVGEYILAQSKTEHNPYQAWIDTYASDEFARAVTQAVAITNRHAELADQATREKMNQAFTTAAKLEWKFWDSAYQQEQWEL